MKISKCCQFGNHATFLQRLISGQMNKKNIKKSAQDPTFTNILPLRFISWPGRLHHVQLKNEMKKQIVGFLTLAIAGSILFVACNKDNSDNPLPAQVVKLTKSGWKINSITRPKISDPTQDSVISKTCASDDSIGFSLQGNYEFSDGATKCDSTIFPYSKGAWLYDLVKDSIRMATSAPAGKYYSWKVLALNDSVLKVNYTDSTVPASKFTKTVLFKR